MVGYRNTSDVAKKAAEVAQKMNSRAHGEFYIHNGSEITTWMGHSFSTKNKIQTNIFKIKTSILNFKLQIIIWHKDTGAVRQVTKTAIFIAAPMKVHI